MCINRNKSSQPQYICIIYIEREREIKERRERERKERERHTHTHTRYCSKVYFFIYFVIHYFIQQGRLIQSFCLFKKNIYF